MNTYYKPTLGSMRDYAAGKIAALKLCSPPMEDKEIICLLTRHFPYSIQNLIRSIAPRDIEAFQSLLGNYDITADNVMKGGKTSTTINAISTSVGGQRQNHRNRAINQTIKRMIEIRKKITFGMKRKTNFKTRRGED